MRRQLIACAAVVVAATAAGTAPARVPEPRMQTIATTPAPIHALAQDGPNVAWETACCDVRVTIKPVHRARTATFETPLLGDRPGRRFFALAQERALWSIEAVGNNTWIYPMTATAGGRVQRSGQLVYGTDLIGTHAGGAAGDGHTLVFSTIEVGADATTCDDQGLNCTPIVTGGGVLRVMGRRHIAVPGAPPAFLVAASGTRIATVAALASPNEQFARFGPDRPVGIRDAVTGRPAARFVPAGTVRALALTPTYAAVLVARGSARRVERYGLDGRLISTTAVPAAAADELGASSSTVVFRVGRSIRTLEVRTGSVRQVALARSLPVGLSIESNRIVWAERSGGRSLIRALWL